MSAFVIDDTTMTAAVRAICSLRHDAHARIMDSMGGHITDSARAATQIGRHLFALNIEAVTQRYPDCRNNPDNLPGPNGAAEIARAFSCNTPTEALPVADLVAGYQALSCLEYQCSEGNVPESREFAEIIEAQHRVADTIIRQLPEFAAARRKYWS